MNRFSKINWGWLAAFAPLITGALLSAALFNGLLPNPVFRVTIDLAFVFFTLGLFLTFPALFAAFWANSLEKCRAETQLEAASERRRFLQRLDHELKNPLTAILAGLVNLSSAPEISARQEALESVEAQAQRISRLAADLRKLAELETRPLERSMVDMGELLQEVFYVAEANPRAAELHLAFTIPQAPWPLPSILGDQDLLFLAVHNLMDNAMKFTPSGGTVELRGFEDGALVVVEVADTGPGIPTEDYDLVWEELYRGQSARGVPGSGLGLALVRSITERHGGQVNLRSRVQSGTVFALRLPIHISTADQRGDAVTNL